MYWIYVTSIQSKRKCDLEIINSIASVTRTCVTINLKTIYIKVKRCGWNIQVVSAFH